jgi:DNA-binding CsgD family transcriptional regulator
MLLERFIPASSIAILSCMRILLQGHGYTSRCQQASVSSPQVRALCYDICRRLRAATTSYLKVPLLCMYCISVMQGCGDTSRCQQAPLSSPQVRALCHQICWRVCAWWEGGG